MPMIRRRAVLTLALVLVSGGVSTSVQAQEAPRNPLRRLQGTWTGTFENLDLSWVFEGESVTATIGDRTYEAGVTIDREATPRTITFTVNEGPDDAQGQTVQGIFKVEEGKLVVCTGAPGAERPGEFRNAPDEGLYLFTLSRKAGEGDGPSPERQALRRMQGTWKATLPDGGAADFVIRGRRVTVDTADRHYVAQVAVQPGATPHATIDFEVVEGPDDAKGRTVQGIYRQDGDTLVFCVDSGANARPAEFRTSEGESILFELKKAEPKN